MGQTSSPSQPKQLLEEVLNFVDQSSGLSCRLTNDGVVSVDQAADGKIYSFQSGALDEVLHRCDSDGKDFIQLNFKSGIKVLFTDTLVGFKPSEVVGLDMGKIPKVVTTPDLMSVFEALEETLSSDAANENEVEILKRVYQAILVGGEDAGFDLRFEKNWLSRLMTSQSRASA